MRSDEKGFTMVEVIVAVALFAIVMPLIWNYLNGAFVDSANINNKVAVQTTVNSLMNNIQKHVQEASNPITDTPSDVSCKADTKGESGVGGSIKILKPGNIIVTYTYNNEAAAVEYNMSRSGEQIDSGKFDNISEFVVEFKTVNVEGEEIPKGIKVTVVGKIDDKSKYSLTNEYYTRNTI